MCPSAAMCCNAMCPSPSWLASYRCIAMCLSMPSHAIFGCPGRKFCFFAYKMPPFYPFWVHLPGTFFIHFDAADGYLPSVPFRFLLISLMVHSIQRSKNTLHPVGLACRSRFSACGCSLRLGPSTRPPFRIKSMTAPFC